MTGTTETRVETRGAALRRLSAALAAAGLDTPDLDARLLLAHVLGVEPLQLLTERHALVPTSAQPNIADVTARRLAREPVSRILGERWFYGRPFLVTPATLDPRPDSETLVQAACALMRETRRGDDTLRVLDIGTGTGCLLLTVLLELSEFSDAQGVGTDVSAAALAVAAKNHRRLRAAGDALRRVTWREGDGFAPVRGSNFNLIISNPPYIPSSDIANLDPDVRHFDPKLALDGGADGLDHYRALAKDLSDYLTEGWVVFEVGSGQAEAVSALLHSAFHPQPVDLRVFKDLAGVERCVAASPLRSGAFDAA